MTIPRPYHSQSVAQANVKITIKLTSATKGARWIQNLNSMNSHFTEAFEFRSFSLKVVLRAQQSYIWKKSQVGQDDKHSNENNQLQAVTFYLHTVRPPRISKQCVPVIASLEVQQCSTYQISYGH